MQNEFSLLYRVEAEETLKTTRELNIGFVAYSPLGRGLMTGVIDDQNGMSEGDTRRRHPRFAAQNLSHNLALVHGLEEIAQERHCTLGQLGAGVAVGARRGHRADPGHQAEGKT